MSRSRHGRQRRKNKDEPRHGFSLREQVTPYICVLYDLPANALSCLRASVHDIIVQRGGMLSYA